MSPLLTWLEASALGHVMRETGPWTYATVNLVHILGIAALFGAVVILDLRLLGAWRRVPLGTLAEVAVPVAVVGFVVAAMSGVSLISANGSEYIGNPFLLVKFPAIGIGVLNALVGSRTPGWKARHLRRLTSGEERRLAWLGGVSLASWLTAIAAGRMIGYW